MAKGIARLQLDGSVCRIAIVRTRWNPDVVDLLERRCLVALTDSGVPERNIFRSQVPGSFELPMGARRAIDHHEVDAVIVLGTLVKGETMHFEYISAAVADGVMSLSLERGVPIIYGVLNCLSEEQAVHRASQDGLDHGYEWGLSAVEMTMHE